MRVLIFGANGQDGYYLANLCQTAQIEVHGVSRSGDWLKGDVQNFAFVSNLIKTIRPTHIFHFAAVSSTRHETLFPNHNAISTGTLNILEAVKSAGTNSKVFLTGSGVQFQNTGTAISEHETFAPSSAYSVARIHSVYLGRYYRQLGLPVYVGYLFHHESPRRSSRHISQQVVTAAKRIAEGSKEILHLGDMTVEKEWSFSGDIVQGMWALVSQDEVFEAVIGSGKAYSIQQWVEACFGRVGKNWCDYVKVDEKFTPEYSRLVSNPSTMRLLGWQPTVEFQDLVAMMMSQLQEVQPI